MGRALTRPRRTSTSASHCRSSGNASSALHRPARASAQYASCLSLSSRAVLYLAQTQISVRRGAGMSRGLTLRGRPRWSPCG